MQNTNTLEILDLHVNIENEKILKGINLQIKAGEIHVIMGKNGSGKSTLCKSIMGHPQFKPTKGKVFLNKINVLKLKPNERANLGIFLAFQDPKEITGVKLGKFLRLAKNANQKAENPNSEPVSPIEFLKILKENYHSLKMEERFIHRSINEGFSGGEKKKSEIIQMKILEPKIALLDEIDSGLDIDALKIVSKAIMETHKKNNSGILLVTHYTRILQHIKPDHVHIMHNGKIIKSGGTSLAHKLEEEGYEKFIK